MNEISDLLIKGKTVQDIIAEEKQLYIKTVLMNYVVPKIKGEITRGKIKWRGVSIVSKPTPDGESFYLEQRGKCVFPPLAIIVSPQKTTIFNPANVSGKIEQC